MNQALWHIDPQSSVLREVHLDNDPAFIQLRSVCSLISKGTERTVAMGHCDKSFEEFMQVPYMKGSFDLPVNYGYSMVGEKMDRKGEFYHFMHPHQSICEVSPQNITQIPIGMPPKRASLISNMETVINAMWDARIQAGEKVLIIGFGAIGSLLGITLQNTPGIDLQILDLDPWKDEKAQELGINSWSGKLDFDCVFHVSASSSGLQQAIDLCKPEGKVIELSWYGNKPVQIQLGTSFHYGRKSIISSQVSQIPAHMSSTWDYIKRKQLAIDLLMDDTYDALISHSLPFATIPDFFDKLRKGTEGPGLNWLIEYPSS